MRANATKRIVKLETSLYLLTVITPFVYTYERLKNILSKVLLMVKERNILVMFKILFDVLLKKMTNFLKKRVTCRAQIFIEKNFNEISLSKVIIP